MKHLLLCGMCSGLRSYRDAWKKKPYYSRPNFTYRIFHSHENHLIQLFLLKFMTKVFALSQREKGICRRIQDSDKLLLKSIWKLHPIVRLPQRIYQQPVLFFHNTTLVQGARLQGGLASFARGNICEIFMKTKHYAFEKWWLIYSKMKGCDGVFELFNKMR